MSLTTWFEVPIFLPNEKLSRSGQRGCLLERVVPERESAREGTICIACAGTIFPQPLTRLIRVRLMRLLCVPPIRAIIGTITSNGLPTADWAFFNVASTHMKLSFSDATVRTRVFVHRRVFFAKVIRAPRNSGIDTAIDLVLAILLRSPDYFWHPRVHLHAMVNYSLTFCGLFLLHRFAHNVRISRRKT